jgi:hypothetical protein
MKLRLSCAVLFWVLISLGRSYATFDEPVLIYTVETIESDSESSSIPDGVYLYPRIYVEAIGDSQKDYLVLLLRHLREQKPDLYRDVKILPPFPARYPYKLVHVMTPVKNEDDFKTQMSELVYTLNNSAFKHGDVSVAFEFKDSVLEMKLGGRKFTKKDVALPVFILETPKPSKK